MSNVKTKNNNLLFEVEISNKTGMFPTTRYQGSKYKILEWIKQNTQNLEFNSVLDAFGGTGSVGYMFKQQGKQVAYNDLLKFNYHIGLALIENSSITLDDKDIKYILGKHNTIEYPDFIAKTFTDIYFTDDENIWLDRIITNIRHLDNKYKQALAYFALFQASIIKRPYNLFHRKNLYIRTAEVGRSFGNKTTWDTPFEEHFLKFAKEANNAVFDNGKKNKVYCGSIFNLDIHTPDMVYIDTPYISSKNVGVNYGDFYHFLEGIVHYDDWENIIDHRTKHKKLRSEKNEWCDKQLVYGAFERLFDKFKDSILVISYRDDGIPSTDELVEMLKKIKSSVEVKKLDYKYVLSNNNSKEVLIIAQ